MGLQKRDSRTYASIISDGSIRVKTQETNPQAEKREYTLKDGTTGTKYELVFDSLSGIITGIQFFEGQFGKQLNVSFKDGDDEITLSMNLASNFAEDFLKKLPNIRLDEQVTVAPYSFEDDKKKLRKGVTVYQGGDKLGNYFNDPKTKENTHGFPNPEKDYKEMDSDDWKAYFIKTRKFLQAFTEENILPAFQNFEAPSQGEDVSVEDVKF